MRKEKWAHLPAIFNLYQVSNYGRIRRKTSKGFRYLAGGNDTNGYHYVKLSFRGFQKNKSIHRLVASAFIKNPKNKPQVNHIDGDKTNNYYKNLEWATASENMFHSYNVLNNLPAYGEARKKSCKLSEKDVKEIRRRAGTITNIELAKLYNISSAYVSDVIRRVTWKHL